VPGRARTIAEYAIARGRDGIGLFGAHAAAYEAYAGVWRARQSIMILPQVHLRKPCYDFYFL